ncbi:alpha/beta-hydrolase [Dacryopinax primogenitus]|uniref:Alpha/beta-hydrolase n=1 Tax=Dacryopinax primogenitus (strain DJM 731) TaxID=1858805 RepID=M5G6J8_DACPD|nr:alpha/beta-hydrolase [Dacryopinax primogenitus]EJU01447.1 alpha/beta-hydrolase [Dacryopinax primogenitus]
MARFPLLGRLRLSEYGHLILGSILLILESFFRIATYLLPEFIVDWFYQRSRQLWHTITGQRQTTELPKSQQDHRELVERVRAAVDFEELCNIWGYVPEEHVVQTKDGYLLAMHRLPCKKGEKKARPGTTTGKPVVYLHHGLLMNSEVWVCVTAEERCLPFVLAEAGYDVWLGNNRGNKYSRKTAHMGNVHTDGFWDYSIDEFCLFDIPDSIHYILKAAKVDKLSYIGFSQGSAQAFAALSVHPDLNEVVDIFVALAPAMAPPGLSSPIVDALTKASPSLMYLFFGRRAILSSATFWQSVLYPPIFVKMIDIGLVQLFNWRSRNITQSQKIAAYAHLYSFTSVKSVVHWFQIMRNQKFQMYDEDFEGPSMALSRRSFFHPARFPTRNIMTPIVLLYGESDSLVDIDVMLKELPEHTVAIGIPGHEHVDMLWGEDVHKLIIPRVLDALKEIHAPRGDVDQGETVQGHEVIKAHAD